MIFEQKLHTTRWEILKVFEKSSKLVEYLSSLCRLKGHSLGFSHKRNWGRKFILLLPQTAALPGLNAAMMVLSQQWVSPSKTV